MLDTNIEASQEESPKPRLYQRLIQIAKQLWMVLILLGLAVFVSNNFDNIVEQLQQVSATQIILSLILIAFGRLLMMIVAHDALVSLGETISLKSVLAIVSISDPAKYLPGGIWHFVGRAGYYQVEGVNLKTTTQALLRENLWLVVSAGMTGAIFLILAYANQNFWFLCAAFFVLWWMILKLWSKRFSTIRIIIQMLIQFTMWFALAASFIIIFPSIPASIEHSALVIAAFTLSWLIGFISLFAPSGLGIREAILVALLLPLLSTSDSSVLALTHRILWIGVELVFTLVAWVFFNQDLG